MSGGRALLVAGLMALVFTGCATVSGGDGSFTAIVKDDAPFSSGPGQDVPDKYLPAGTRVRIVGSGGGGSYIHVQTTSGEVGFVPRALVTAAPDN